MQRHILKELVSKNTISQAVLLEEITSNIKNTNEKTQEMLRISSETKALSIKRKQLSAKTVSSMDKINKQVNAINEISIDNEWESF